jgi:FlaA1/EpsC-like NDP-sugar epimerase
MIARRAPAIVAVTVLVDLMMVTFSYAIARAVWPWHRLPDLETLNLVGPVILATIPCWLVVFFAFGLYRRKQVLEPSLRLTRLLSAIAVSIFVMIVVAFAFNVDALHRTFIVSLWITAMALVPTGRLLVQWFDPPTS